MKWDELDDAGYRECHRQLCVQHIDRYLEMFPPKRDASIASLLEQFYNWSINTHLLEPGKNNPFRQAGYCPVSEAVSVIQAIRKAGYAVVVFTPSEMEETHLQVRDLEDRLCEFGNRVIENNPADDEEEEDGQEEGK
jgi:hypothetical protein